MVGARKPATLADLAMLPEGINGELIDGEMYTQPRPRSLHAGVAMAVATTLRPHFGKRGGDPGGWILLFEPELHLGARPDVLIPDLAGWRRTRLPELPDVPAFTLAPDWVCEVLSPSTAMHDKKRKTPIYARERVGHVWMVDPETRTLDVLRLDGEGYRLLGTWGEEDRVRAEPFDAVEIDLSELWAR